MSREDERNRGYGRFTNTSYFPNANPGSGNQQFPQAPGVAEGQARMDELASQGTYKSRRDDFRNKYPQFANPVAQQNLQQFNVNQARAYGESPASNSQGQLANMQNGQSLGGNYIARNGVFDPNVPKQQGLFNNPSLSAVMNLGKSNLSSIGTFAANLFGGGRQAGTQYGQNVSNGAGNQYAKPLAYNPAPIPYRRYFD